MAEQTEKKRTESQDRRNSPGRRNGDLSVTDQLRILIKLLSWGGSILGMLLIAQLGWTAYNTRQMTALDLKVTGYISSHTASSEMWVNRIIALEGWRDVFHLDSTQLDRRVLRLESAIEVCQENMKQVIERAHDARND